MALNLVQHSTRSPHKSACFVLTVVQFFSVHAFYYPEIQLEPCNPDRPLYLTPYVDSGNISEGRSLARVPLTDRYDIESYAGLFTVNKEYQSNQFFWYFPPMTGNKSEAPVIVWLQGDPRVSSLVGVFYEHGPLMLTDTFEKRLHTWTRNHHVIYIDSPVGAGLSFTKDPRGYCTSDTQIGEQLYSTVYQFFQLFPELQNNKFYVAGEFYGGKYAPALAYTIHKKNPSAIVNINLKGIAVGNGFTNPIKQLIYGTYLKTLGLVDTKQKNEIIMLENKIKALYKNKKWQEAYDTFATLFAENNKTLFFNMTGFEFTHRSLHFRPIIYNDICMRNLIQRSRLHKDIHIGDLPLGNLEEAYRHLEPTMLDSVAPWLSELLDHYSVCMYSGQQNIIVPYRSVAFYLSILEHAGAEEFKKATRRIWKVDGEVAGYVKRGGKLVEVIVRNAGHMVSEDQPKWALDLITRFTHEKPFS